MKSEKGQALLIVVLVMVVVLTIGLSVASRSITNLRLATEQEDSQAAFSAAEAGIERIILSTLTNISGSFGIDDKRAEMRTTSMPIGGTEFLLNNGKSVAKDDGADVWLSNHPDYTSPLSPQFFSVYWGSSLEGNCSVAAAVEIIAVYGSKANPLSKRFTFDPCQTRTNPNSFSFIGPANIGAVTRAEKTFYYKTPDNFLNGINDIFIIRIIPLYASTPIGVYTCNPGNPGNNCTPLPSQGKVINSTGSSGGTQRKITYYQGYPKLPSEFFHYVLFSSIK